MQQFTVPQFIDVESQIFGPITVRQFMIFMVAAIIIGLSYRLFDFTLFLAIAIIVGILGITFAFVKINGRPFHFFILNVVQTWRRPHLRVWNHQPLDNEAREEKVKIAAPVIAASPKAYKASRLAELALIVDTKGRYKGE